jgi:hypothetical protein
VALGSYRRRGRRAKFASFCSQDNLRGDDGELQQVIPNHRPDLQSHLPVAFTVAARWSAIGRRSLRGQLPHLPVGRTQIQRLRDNLAP